MIIDLDETIRRVGISTDDNKSYLVTFNDLGINIIDENDHIVKYDSVLYNQILDFIDKEDEEKEQFLREKELFLNYTKQQTNDKTTNN